jgi:hypothetical protein
MKEKNIKKIFKNNRSFELVDLLDISMERKNKTNKGGVMKIETIEQYKALTEDEKLAYYMSKVGNKIRLEIIINDDSYSEKSLHAIGEEIRQELFAKRLFVKRLGKEITLVQSVGYIPEELLKDNHEELLKD